jgi:uncharacterized protein YecT (DUF1311 family)
VDFGVYIYFQKRKSMEMDISKCQAIMKGSFLAVSVQGNRKVYMRNQMQNISFLAIVAVLLGCAFFFSQQTKLGTRTIQATVTSIPSGKTIADIPDCQAENTLDAQINCYLEAVEISQQLLDARVDEILAMEAKSERRVAFLEVEFAWEESRDADCAFLVEMTSDDDEASLNESACLHEHNLDRLAHLEELYCEWYAISPCLGTAATEE